MGENAAKELAAGAGSEEDALRAVAQPSEHTPSLYLSRPHPGGGMRSAERGTGRPTSGAYRSKNRWFPSPATTVYLFVTEPGFLV
ncbi:hypothetical protein SAMN05443665_106718 [Actinomadura meyerae]|uniref:Uncharacterized protein n=1 Tax=Actinomadura meyerae TaxID=240840 RepID=A0A239P5P0_9ACTN|nr:hypothetical protein SAMN05443665_106718 [Actinomadura meyerae]